MATDGDRLAVFWHPAVLDHDTGHGLFDRPPSEPMEVDETHVEGPDRVRNMHSILKRGPVAEALDWHDGRLASDEEILRFHQPAYLDSLKAAEQEGGKRFSLSTVWGRGSWTPVAAAAGTAIAAAQHVMAGNGAMAYALVRPPGHHAAPARADGYCFVNNIGVAVEAGLRAGAKRVAVIDWDVHHGNGTQAGFYGRDDVLTISLHMDHGAWGPTHPETGQADETGQGRGRGYNLNLPLPMGMSDCGYRQAFERLVAPAVSAFKPDLIVIACGQDANQFDPNGRMLVSMRGFHWLGGAARNLARRLGKGKLLLVQEGGYQVSYAALCLHATLEGVLGRPLGLKDPLAFLPDVSPLAETTIAAIGQTWMKNGVGDWLRLP